MKKLIFISMVFLGIKVNAQSVGINTNSPATTLDVTGVPATTTVADGIIPPRITKQQLNSKASAYGANQIGAIVYVTDTNNTALGTSTSKISQPGYYNWDGTLWQPMSVSTNKVSGFFATGSNNKAVLGNISAYCSGNNNSLTIMSATPIKVRYGTTILDGTSTITLTDFNSDNPIAANTAYKPSSYVINQAGAVQQIYLIDRTNNIAYRILFIVDLSFTSNFISIERLN